MKKNIQKHISFCYVLLSLYAISCGNNDPKNHDKTKEETTEIVNNSEETEPFKNMLTSYYKLTESFVNWEENALYTNCNDFKTALLNVKFDGLKKDSLKYLKAMKSLTTIKNFNEELYKTASLEGKRKIFNQISENLKALVEVTKYTSQKTYWMKCPMAFNDEIAAYWLSDTDEIRNPYLGTKHPKYKATMLHCGSNEGEIVVK